MRKTLSGVETATLASGQGSIGAFVDKDPAVMKALRDRRAAKVKAAKPTVSKY
jgi:hypothetical protein